MMRWAIIDVETTGLHVVHDRIIEIALRIYSNQRLEYSWNRLINPNRTIPKLISSLTGITDELVEKESAFEACAGELFNLLQGCILVAHNARFDYGFLKNAFKRAGYVYKAQVLCTIKLMRLLAPEHKTYQLDSLVRFYDIKTGGLHRVETCVDALSSLIEKIFEFYTKEHVEAVAKSLYQCSSIPSRLKTDIKGLPDTAGVYLFYSKNSTIPFYIGKSIHLRQRVLSHFQADHMHAKEFTMAQQIERIETIQTAGELSALLLESELIKKHKPVYNRRLRRVKHGIGFKLNLVNDYLTISLERISLEEGDHFKAKATHGTFRSMAAAKQALLFLVKNHQLCPKLAHLENSTQACFSYQLKRCKGACIGEESSEDYNARVQEALKDYQEEIWPYSGAIAIKEHCSVNKITHFLVVYQWRFLGYITEEYQLKQWEHLATKAMNYHDTYKILFSYLNSQSDKEIIDLSLICSEGTDEG